MAGEIYFVGTYPYARAFVSRSDGLYTWDSSANSGAGAAVLVSALTTAEFGDSSHGRIALAQPATSTPNSLNQSVGSFPANFLGNAGNGEWYWVAYPAAPVPGQEATLGFPTPIYNGAVVNMTSLAALFTGPVISGSVNDAGATSTVFIGNSGLSATNDFYVGSVLVFTSGDLQGIARRIVDYVGASKTITLSPALPAAPANSVTFKILGRID